jgi:hypothetical protein
MTLKRKFFCAVVIFEIFIAGQYIGKAEDVGHVESLAVNPGRATAQSTTRRSLFSTNLAKGWE